MYFRCRVWLRWYSAGLAWVRPSVWFLAPHLLDTVVQSCNSDSQDMKVGDQEFKPIFACTVNLRLACATRESDCTQKKTKRKTTYTIMFLSKSVLILHDIIFFLWEDVYSFLIQETDEMCCKYLLKYGKENILYKL